MKSLYISYDGVLEPLGQSQIISYLKELSKHDITFILLTFDKKCFEDKDDKYKLLQELRKKNIHWISLPYHKRPLVISTIYDILTGLIISLVVVKREKIEVVHARSYVAALIALFLKKIFKIKFIFDMRGFLPDIKAESNHWNKRSLLYKISKNLEKQFLKNADEVIVLTKYAKKNIEKNIYGYSSISIIPCCVNIDFFKPDLELREKIRKQNNLTNKFIFAHSGSLENWYMKYEMLEYFKTAKNIIDNAHFLILTRSSREEILSLISDKQLDINDFTIRSVRFEQMPEYLSIVDAGIIFLSLGFSKSACLPTKFSEFLSCGIPVISSAKIGDTEDIIIKNKIGVIINNFNENEYKKSFLDLLALVKNNDLKSRCRRVAQEEFSLQLGVDRYQRIYSKLEK